MALLDLLDRSISDLATLTELSKDQTVPDVSLPLGRTGALKLKLRCDLEHCPVAVNAAIVSRAVEIAGGIED